MAFTYSATQFQEYSDNDEHYTQPHDRVGTGHHRTPRHSLQTLLLSTALIVSHESQVAGLDEKSFQEDYKHLSSPEKQGFKSNQDKQIETAN